MPPTNFDRWHFLELAGGGHVQDHRHVGVALEDPRRNVRGDWSQKARPDRRGLLFTEGQQDDPLGGHDRGDPHRVGVAWHLFWLVKEAGVVVNRRRGQGHPVGMAIKGRPGFVEADVAVAPHPQHL